MVQQTHQMGDQNPTYINECEHARSHIWHLNHRGVDLNVLKRMQVLGYIEKKVREKASIAKKKWDGGQRNPDPYDEVSVHFAAINECLNKCERLMEDCHAASTTWQTEQYDVQQAKRRLDEAEERFKSARKKALDSLNTKKNPELAELVQQLR